MGAPARSAQSVARATCGLDLRIGPIDRATAPADQEGFGAVSLPIAAVGAGFQREMRRWWPIDDSVIAPFAAPQALRTPPQFRHRKLRFSAAFREAGKSFKSPGSERMPPERVIFG